MSAWANKEKLSIFNSSAPPLISSSLVKLPYSKDRCGGFLREPLIQGKCVSVTRKFPKQLCGKMFMYRKSQNDVCKEFCEQHRYCFLPLPDGTRCTNLRRDVYKNYCELHIVQEKQCGNLVSVYKNACGDDPQRLRCEDNDTPDLLAEKERHFERCFTSRRDHQQKCIHPSTTSLGHAHFLQQIFKMDSECRGFLSDKIVHKENVGNNMQSSSLESDSNSTDSSDSSNSSSDVYDSNDSSDYYDDE